METSDAIAVDRLSKRFGTFVALNQVDLHLPAGGVLLLAGPNGAGKSTLLRLLAGIGRPTSGQVRVAGANPHGSPEARSAIGLLSHQTLLYDDLTARENGKSGSIRRWQKPGWPNGATTGCATSRAA